MKMLVLCLALGIAPMLAAPICAQDTTTLLDDFSITLKRVGCVGTCPDYEVTILGNGRVRYQGHAYVLVEGVRERTIPIANVQKLMRRLQDEQFFQWDEKDVVCLDFPEVHITASLGAHRKHVLEGCNSRGKVLSLAKEIDRVSGAKRWVR
jgi:hypothetical protein